jgi:hypothetical protein
MFGPLNKCKCRADMIPKLLHADRESFQNTDMSQLRVGRSPWHQFLWGTHLLCKVSRMVWQRLSGRVRTGGELSSIYRFSARVSIATNWFSC